MPTWNCCCQAPGPSAKPNINLTTPPLIQDWIDSLLATDWTGEWRYSRCLLFPLKLQAISRLGCRCSSLVSGFQGSDLARLCCRIKNATSPCKKTSQNGSMPPASPSATVGFLFYSSRCPKFSHEVQNVQRVRSMERRAVGSRQTSMGWDARINTTGHDQSAATKAPSKETANECAGLQTFSACKTAAVQAIQPAQPAAIVMRSRQSTLPTKKQ